MDLDLESTNSLLGAPEKRSGSLDRLWSRSHFNSSQKTLLHYLISFLVGCFPAVAFVIFTKSGQNGVAPLYLSPVPKMRQEIRTFEWDYVFTGLPSVDSDAAWKSLLPFGRGYIFVGDATAYSLPPGEATPNGQVYSVAMYHQLHCLSIIRHDYFALVSGLLKNATDVRDVVVHQVETSHNRHCMDYLRQTIECHADMTIEWERTEADGSRFQVDGMAIKHECAIEASVHKFMEGQREIVEKERELKIKEEKKE